MGMSLAISYARRASPFHKNNFWANLAAGAKTRDRILKFSGAVLEIVALDARKRNASPVTQERLNRAITAIRITRDVQSVFNAWSGVLPEVIENLKKMGLLSREFFKLEEVMLTDKPNKYSDTALGKREKLLAIGGYTGKIIGGASAFVGFACLRTPALFLKYVLHQKAERLNQGFSVCMLVNNGGELMGASFSLTHEILAYRRSGVGRWVEVDNEDGLIYDGTKLKTNERKAMVENVLSIGEKALDITVGVMEMTQNNVPAEVVLALKLSNAFLGLSKECLKAI